MIQYQYVMFIFNGVTKDMSIVAQPAGLKLEKLPNGDVFNYLGKMGFKLHTYTALVHEIVYIFERSITVTNIPNPSPPPVPKVYQEPDLPTLYPVSPVRNALQKVADAALGKGEDKNKK